VLVGEEPSPFLLKIIRSSLASGHIPSLWAWSKIIFIPKQVKKDNTDPEVYRLISLTSFILNATEKVVDTLKRNRISSKQHAYRIGKSTELTFVLQHTVQNNEIGIGAFLDTEGAFDNTTQEALCDALRRKNVEPTICNWTESMFASRSAEIKVGDRTIAVDTTKGYIQGGALSLLLWSILVDKMLIELMSNGITCQDSAF